MSMRHFMGASSPAALRLLAPLTAAAAGLILIAPVSSATAASIGEITVLISNNGAAAQFVQAVNTAGTTVRIEARVELNLSGLSGIYVAPGVQIVGMADAAHPNGPRLYTTSAPSRLLNIGTPDDRTPSDGVRISGIRLDGGLGTGISDGAMSEGITDWSGINVEIDHDEVYGWSGAAIEIHDNDALGGIPAANKNRMTALIPTVVHIHDNYIHHNQHYGENGYGVAVYDGATAMVEQNVFDYNRHDVSGDGRPGTGYWFDRNLLLPHGGVNATTLGIDSHTHVIDMHGRDSCFHFGYYCGPAGEFMDIEYNTVLYDQGTDFKLRGTPSIGVTVAHNVFARTDKWNQAPGGIAIFDDAAMVQTDDLDHRSIAESDNTLGYTYNKFTTDNLFGDFDGDGVQDRLSTTGQTWWYFSSLHQRWTFLRQSTAARSVSVGDFDGDGTTDISAGGNLYSHGSQPAVASPAAYQDARTHHLMRLSLDGMPHDTGYPMKAGTSPAAAALSNSAYETAFVGPDGYLWVLDPNGKAHWAGNGLGVAPGTSPAIAADPNDNSYRISWNAAGSHVLWTYSSITGIGTPNLDGSRVRANTSPSITRLTAGGFQTVFVNASDGFLWEYGDAVDRRVGNGLGVAPGTSPSVSAGTFGGYEIAFTASGTNRVWTVVANVGKPNIDGLTVKAGSGPAVTALPSGGYQIGFTNATDGLLWESGDAGNRRVSNGLGVAGRTTVGIAPQYSGTDHAFAFNAGDGHLWTVDSFNINHRTTGLVAPGTNVTTVW